MTSEEVDAQTAEEAAQHNRLIAAKASASMSVVLTADELFLVARTMQDEAANEWFMAAEKAVAKGDTEDVEVCTNIALQCLSVAKKIMAQTPIEIPEYQG